MKKLFIGLMTLSFLMISCKKETASGASHPPDTHEQDSTATGFAEPGYGHSTKPFTGKAWSLPASVEMTEKFHQYMYCALLADTLHTTALKNYNGVPGGLFQVCFTLHNHSGLPVTIHFPEELVIVSSSLETQNGLIIDLGEVIVPGNTSITLFAGGFCLNEDRSFPAVYDNDGNTLSWSFGPSEVPSQLKEITDIVHSKNIQFEDVVNAEGTQFDNGKYEKVFTIQKAIWEVTESDGLTSATREKLRNLSL